uniref:Uncharacterized protein n=1 Tax=viral metagenome TaxID=1070528 RepID=A0A6H1ZZX5_9ZZZZ
MAIDVPDEHIFVRPGRSILAEGQNKYMIQDGLSLLPGASETLAFGPGVGWVLSVSMVTFKCEASCIQKATVLHNGVTFEYYYFDLNGSLIPNTNADFILTHGDVYEIIITNNDTVAREMYVTVYGTAERVS